MPVPDKPQSRKITTSTTLHQEAYQIYRRYLDATYFETDLDKLCALSIGYPSMLSLLDAVLELLCPSARSRPGYGWEGGEASIREVAIRYENASHDTRYRLENICIIAGASYGLNRVLEYLFTDASLDRSKDELLVIAPNFYRLLGRAESYARIKNVVAQEENDFQITPDEVWSALTPRTKAVFLTNPSNPSSLYYKGEDLEALIDGLSEKGVYLIIDESGDGFCCTDSYRMTPRLQDPYVIRIATASKKYLLAEYRIGYILADESFIGDGHRGFVKMIGDDMSKPAAGRRYNVA